MKNNIIYLPNEIIINIFSYLDIINQYNLSKTCIKFSSLYYNTKIKHERFLYKCENNEWIDFISFINKHIIYTIDLNNKIDDEHILIIVSDDYVLCYDFYKKKNYKYTNIHDLIKYINSTNYNYIVFLTHRIKIPLYLNYNIFKKIQ